MLLLIFILSFVVAFIILVVISSLYGLALRELKDLESKHQKLNQTKRSVKREKEYARFVQRTRSAKEQHNCPRSLLKSIQALLHNPAVADDEDEQKVRVRGKGVVLYADGFAALTQAYVTVHHLREHFPSVSVELWHSDHDVPQAFLRVFQQLQVSIRALPATVEHFPSFHAVFHSHFREVLLVKPGTVFCDDPLSVFETEAYTESAAVFWPDVWRLDKQAPVFEAIDVVPYYTHAQSDDLVLVNKGKCLATLQNLLTILERHGTSLFQALPEPDNVDTYKDLWHIVFLAQQTPFHMVEHPVAVVGSLKGEFEGNARLHFHPAQADRQLCVTRFRATWEQVSEFPLWSVVLRPSSSSMGDEEGWVEPETLRPTGPDVREWDALRLLGPREDEAWVALRTLRRQTWYRQEYARLLPRRHLELRPPREFVAQEEEAEPQISEASDDEVVVRSTDLVLSATP
jgi:hypothetical protein